MTKVTIRSKVTMDQADHERIMAFAERSEANAPLRDLGKLFGEIITFNIKNMLGQIAAAEAQEQATADAKVALYGPDGKPLVADGPKVVE